MSVRLEAAKSTIEKLERESQSLRETPQESIKQGANPPLRAVSKEEEPRREKQDLDAVAQPDDLQTMQQAPNPQHAIELRQIISELQANLRRAQAELLRTKRRLQRASRRAPQQLHPGAFLRRLGAAARELRRDLLGDAAGASSLGASAGTEQHQPAAAVGGGSASTNRSRAAAPLRSVRSSGAAWDGVSSHSIAAAAALRTAEL